MDNQKIAGIFQEIGDMLEILGENVFRVNSYHRAAQVIAHFPHDLRDVFASDPERLEKIPGIGASLTEKIVEMLKTGTCRAHEELVKKFPKGLLDMLRLRTVGPKKVKLFFSELKIQNIEQLKKAAESHKICTLPKMGEKSEQEILKAIEEFSAYPHERRLLHESVLEAEKYVSYLKKSKEVEQVQYAGSLRRKVETVGDIDILAAARSGFLGTKKTRSDLSRRPDLMEHFIKYPEVANVIAKGPTKSAVILKSGIQVDLRVISKNIFGAALHYFTGSKEHNIRIRDLAKRRGLKVSEYGVFRVRRKKEIFIAGKTEEEVFASVGFPYIEPEMRENRGEIELCLAKKKLPDLIELKNLKGDLHVHSKWSDGSEPIETVATAYKNAGFDYIALTDHSPAIGITHGLKPDRVKMQWDEIDELNKALKPFRILKGTEVDILRDGSLNHPEYLLKKFDLVVASVHLNFNLPEEEQTKRIIRAIESGSLHILGHPTGRLINERTPYKVNLEKVIKAAVKNHVALEINSSPSRMDLNDVYVKMAADMGAKFAISTDAHHSSQREFLQYGVAIARRGWLEKKDVVNTLPLEKLFSFFRK